jgi:hypothetical protein
VRVIHLARRDAQPGDVDEQLLGGVAERGRGGARLVERAGELLGERRCRRAQE